MTNIKFLTAAIALALCVAAPANSLADNDKARKPKKTKAELVRENERYVRIIDSLKAELNDMAYRDSIATEMMDIYSGTDTVFEYTNEVTDSLLDIWTLHNSIGNIPDVESAMDTVRFASSVPDSVYINRIKNMNSFITLPYNSIVRNHIILYSEKMPDKIGKIIGLCKFYMPIFEEIFNKYDMPEELKAMAVIESALNPVAVSRAGAKGMWQFMYQTAKNYGLRIDSFVDERMDYVKSADAAARYLYDSYRIFGDWNLAIASYNCGLGNVNRAIRRSGGKREFWDIYPYLPRETRGYVPAFVGALYTMKYYKEHGIVPENPALPSAVDTFKINRMLHLKQVSEVVGVPIGELRRLNPQYRHDIIPGNEREYILRIPYNYVNDFIDAGDSLYTHKAYEYFNPVTIKNIKSGGDGQRIVYRVKSGDVLGKIALRYRVTVAQIKKWNNLKSNTIRVGQRLVIYTGRSAPAGSSSSGTKGSSAKYTVYVVKKGDTLYDIAKAYPGVSAKNIMDYNGIGPNIRPGMKIKIPNL